MTKTAEPRSQRSDRGSSRYLAPSHQRYKAFAAVHDTVVTAIGCWTLSEILGLAERDWASVIVTGNDFALGEVSAGTPRSERKYIVSGRHITVRAVIEERLHRQSADRAPDQR